MPDVEIEINLEGVYKKLSSENIERGRFAMANQIMLDMDQYVPKKKGDLRANAGIMNDAHDIRYNQPYARAQFYGKGFGKGVSYDFQRYSTPGTGPRWDLKAKGIHGNDWPKAFMKGAGL